MQIAEIKEPFFLNKYFFIGKQWWKIDSIRHFYKTENFIDLSIDCSRTLPTEVPEDSKAWQIINKLEHEIENLDSNNFYVAYKLDEDIYLHILNIEQSTQDHIHKRYLININTTNTCNRTMDEFYYGMFEVLHQQETCHVKKYY